MPNNKNLTLKQWAYDSMSPEKARSFLEYFEGRIYKIGKDHKPYLIKDNDLIPEAHFEAYCNDFEWWTNYQGFDF